MIIITGTGRSGTSLLVNTLTHAGLDTGPTTPGFGEHIEAIKINRIILEARGYTPWQQVGEMVQLIGHGIRLVQNPVIKQTDLCHTLDVWWATRQDFKVIVCHRRLDAVRQSFLKASQPFRQDLVATACPQATKDVAVEAWPAFALGQLMDIMLTNRIPHGVFYFPEEMAQAGAAWDRLSPIMGDVIGRDEFVHAMEEVADSSQVHW
jgi:hypothetical protein